MSLLLACSPIRAAAPRNAPDSGGRAGGETLGLIERSRKALEEQRADDAAELLTEALGRGETRGRPERGELLRWLGLSLKAKGEYGKARRVFAESLELREAKDGCFDIACVELLHELGNVAMSDGDPDASLAYLERALEVATAVEGDDSDASLKSWLLLGGAHLGRDEPQLAESALRKAVELGERRREAADDDLQSALFNLAEVLRRTGRSEEAEELVARGMELSVGADGSKN